MQPRRLQSILLCMTHHIIWGTWLMSSWSKQNKNDHWSWIKKQNNHGCDWLFISTRYINLKWFGQHFHSVSDSEECFSAFRLDDFLNWYKVWTYLFTQEYILCITNTKSDRIWSATVKKFCSGQICIQSTFKYSTVCNIKRRN